MKRIVIDANTLASGSVDPTEIDALLRDPADDYLIALARTAGADFIVTGEEDLLEHIDLTPPAINARSACELLGLIDPR